MDIKYKLLEGAVQPSRGTTKSAGWDLYSRDTYQLKPGDLCLVDTGIIAKAPEGYHFKIVIRSGALRKKGLVVANAVGIIDEDYCGPNDIIFVPVFRLPISRTCHGSQKPKLNIGLTYDKFMVQREGKKVQEQNWYTFFDSTPITIERGERIAQLLVEPTPETQWIPFEGIKEDRGGFGSTGEK